MGRGELWGAIGASILRLRGVKVGKRLILYGFPIVSQFPGSRIVLGDDIVAISKSSYTALGVAHPVIIRTLTQTAKISVGANVGLSGVTICAVESVEIGENCLLGAGVTIADTDFHPLEPVGRRSAAIHKANHAPVVIGKNVFVGAGSLVLKGVNIGENSVIGGGSVVTQDIPAESVAAGNPCHVIRLI